MRNLLAIHLAVRASMRVGWTSVMIRATVADLAAELAAATPKTEGPGLLTDSEAAGAIRPGRPVRAALPRVRRECFDDRRVVVLLTGMEPSHPHALRNTLQPPCAALIRGAPR